MATLRPVEAADLPAVSELLDSVFRRPRGIFDQSMVTDFPLVFAPSNHANCRVIVEDDGQIVSHAGLWPRELAIGNERFKVGVLVSVATHPDYRQRGYAAQTVSALQDVLHSEGYDLGWLWTGVPDFYRKLGWEIILPRGVAATLSAEQLASNEPGEFSIEPFDTTQHLAEVISLHDGEPVRFVRGPEEFATLLTLPKLQTWVAKCDEQVTAYAVHADGCNKRGLIEYGGALNGIVALIRHVLDQQPPGAEVPLLAYHLRPDLIAWAQNLIVPTRPLESSKGTAHEMIYPVRPERIPPAVREQLFVWGRGSGVTGKGHRAINGILDSSSTRGYDAYGNELS